MSAREREALEHRVNLLEHRATVVRSRLLRAVEALDARRHRVTTVGKRVRQMVVPAALAVVGVAALLGLGAYAFARAKVQQRGGLVTRRLAQVVRRIDLVSRPSLVRRMFDKAALAIVTLAATELAKRTTKDVIDGRRFGGRLLLARGGTD